MRRLVFLESARLDLADIFEYIARQSGSIAAGRGFAGQLRRQCAKLAALPGTLGRARPELRPDIRSFPFRSYVIVFRYANDRFEVVNVLEGHRDIGGAFDQDNEL